MTYYAHTDREHAMPDDPGALWQPLALHLAGVEELAGRLACATGASPAFVAAARWAGVLHDVGKYADAFQQMLRDAAAGLPKARVQHSAHGAALARMANAVDVAFAVAGHHAGLPAPRGAANALAKRCNDVQGQAETLWEQRARPDLLPYEAPAGLVERMPPTLPRELRGPALDLRIRMLASCLVDADRLDTAGAGYGPHELTDAAERLERVLRYIGGRSAATPVPWVREARQRVLDACLAAAEWSERLLSLTVPTGGGKTLASMAFALRRVAIQPRDARRVIVVIPYLSIIEQNADVYARAIGRDIIVEHHSGDFAKQWDADGEAAGESTLTYSLAVENWDAPIVVTTSVRFFESLFSNHPSDLRRLHNIARSVIILDEVQTLPREYLRALLSMMRGLADEWNATFVFCTATQPAFEQRPGAPASEFRWPRGTIREIIPQSENLFSDLRRVTVTWPGDDATPERWSWSEVAAAIDAEPRALCIVNKREHARLLYEELRAYAGGDSAGLWHLSSRMCPQHRVEVLDQIRTALEGVRAHCRVVSTQLVEAGVDIDFPIVYRAMGPLDSLAQAAGRCDREGRLTAVMDRPAGRLIVFEPDVPESRSTPAGAYTDATRITRTLRQGHLSIDNPAHIAGYFHRYYNTDIDPNDIEALRAQLEFPEVARRFAMIDDRTTSVIIPYNDEAVALLRELESRRALDMTLLRRLQRYQVPLYDNELANAFQAGAIVRAWPESEIWECVPGFYKRDVGFTLESDALLSA